MKNNNVLMSLLLMAMSGAMVNASSFERASGPGWQNTMSGVPGYRPNKFRHDIERIASDTSMDSLGDSKVKKKMLGGNSGTYAPSQIENDLLKILQGLRNLRMEDYQTFQKYFGKSNLNISGMVGYDAASKGGRNMLGTTTDSRPPKKSSKSWLSSVNQDELAAPTNVVQNEIASLNYFW